MDPLGQLESDRLQMARQWLQANQPDRALDTVRRALTEALETTDQARQARAWFEVGWVHAWTGQFDEAEHAFGQAVSTLPGSDADEHPDRAALRLRFLRDHGLLLAQMGQLEPARLAFSRAQIVAGSLHPTEAVRQRALLVLPLAQALLATGEAREAARRLEEALPGLAGAGDENSLLQALTLLAETRATLDEVPLLPHHPPEGFNLVKLAEALAAHVSDLAQPDSDADPVVLRRLLRWFVEWLDITQGEKSRALGDACGLLANLEGKLGDGPARVAAIERAERCYRARNETGYAIQALQGKGLALAQMGELQGAEAAYRAGLDEARASGSAFLVSQLGRNLGQFLADMGRLEEAESLLRESLGQAMESAHPELTGKAATSLGLFLVHAGRGVEARPHFAKALDTLDPDDPYHQAAREHLDCLDRNQTCPCLDPARQTCELYARLLRQQLPGDLVRDLQVRMVDGELETRLDLVRDLTPEEEVWLSRLQAEALDRLRASLGKA